MIATGVATLCRDKDAFSIFKDGSRQESRQDVAILLESRASGIMVREFWNVSTTKDFLAVRTEGYRWARDTQLLPNTSVACSGVKELDAKSRIISWRTEAHERG